MSKTEEKAPASPGFDLSDAFGSSETAEVQGVWVALEGDDDAAVKIARLGNPEAQKAYRRIPKGTRRQIEGGTLGDTEALKFLSDFLAQHVLRDWRGLADKGVALPPYNPEAGAKMLLSLRRFRDLVWKYANDEDLFNVEDEEDAKNLPKRSSGI